MKARVVLDGLFTRRNGKAASNNMPYSFFERYLSVFDAVTVVARCFNVEDDSSQPVEGERINFKSLPGYNGPVGFIKNSITLVRDVFNEAFESDSVVILRLPATIPMLIGLIRTIFNKPFAVELVGDPEDAYSKDSLRSRFSFFYQWMFVTGTRILARKAVCCAYVTREALQAKYPNESMFSFTSLSLKQESISPNARSFLTTIEKPNIVMVAMMQNYYKGHDIAFEAMSILRNELGVEFTLTLIGDGPLRPDLEKIVKDIGLTREIKFQGKLESGNQVFSVMDSADLLILPSRQEGLPRVVIEAMARGLPCICSDVGGTSELVDGVQLLKLPFNGYDLALRIKEICSDVEKLFFCSSINIEKSTLFEATKVQLERTRFYNKALGAANVSI